MSFKKAALLLLIVIVLASSGCNQEKSQALPTPAQTPEVTQTPIATPTPTSTPTPSPSPVFTPLPQPTTTPSPTPTPEDIVVDGNKDNWKSLSVQEKAAVQLALKDKSFRLFYNLPKIHQDYITTSLLWQEKHQNCSPKKRKELQGFVNGIRVTITEIDKNTYKIKATHPLIYKGEKFEWQRTERTITVDIGKNRVINSTFYQPYNGLLLRSVFTAENQLALGFSEYYFGAHDYKAMSDKFAETFCKMSDEDFR